MTKYNIAFLGNQISPGGGSASLLLMMKSLDKRKYNIFVLASDCANLEVKAEFERHAQVVEVNDSLRQFVSCAGSPPTWIKYVKANLTRSKQVGEVLRFLRENEIHLLHVNNAVFSHLLPGIRNSSEVKIVSHIREQVHLYAKKMLEKRIVEGISNNSDFLIGISDNELDPFGDGIDKSVIPNPYDFKDNLSTEPTDFRQEHGVRPDEFLVGMMGRFDKDKGHLLFAQAADHIKKTNPEAKIRFAMVGIGPPKPRWKRVIKRILGKEDFRSSLLSYVHSHDLTSSIVMHPYVKDVKPILKAIDLYVRPSLSRDPWGRDIIEAMAMSKCVLATGSYDLFIKDGVTGYLVDSLNPEVVGNRIHELYNDTEGLKVTGANAYKLVRELTDIEGYGKKVENVYSSIL